MKNDKLGETSSIRAEPNLMEESDRGCVIVAAALIDDQLKSLLTAEASLNNTSQNLISDLFDGNGALATFSGKAGICRAFGLIDDQSYADISVLRKLRNRFAHLTDEVDFLDVDIFNMILTMKCCKDTAKDWEVERFRVEQESKRLPDYEMRSRGFVKYSKSIFCIGIKSLMINMISHDLERQKKRLAAIEALSDPN